MGFILPRRGWTRRWEMAGQGLAVDAMPPIQELAGEKSLRVMLVQSLL